MANWSRKNQASETQATETTQPKIAETPAITPTEMHPVNTEVKTEVITIPKPEEIKTTTHPAFNLEYVNPVFEPVRTSCGSYLIKCNLTRQFGDTFWRNGGLFLREESIVVKTGIKYTADILKHPYVVKGMGNMAVNHGMIVNSAGIEIDGELCVMIHIYDVKVRIYQGDVIAELIIL